MDDFEKYLNKQLEDAEFKAEWDKLELERKSQIRLSRKYARVRLRKAQFLAVKRSVQKGVCRL